MWKTRLTHEAKMHEQNCFVTLTFAEEHLPPDMSVSVRDIQLFMKRLRKRTGKVRFFACAEYGDEGERPHYHLLLFGYDFPDRYYWSRTKSGWIQDRSPILESLWPFGFATVGTVTPESAGYVARYAVKKITGKRAKEHYTRLNPHTGEYLQVRPEFACMSTKPGIGATWYDKFKGDAFPSDFVVVDGSKKPIPRYYLQQLKKETDAKETPPAMLDKLNPDQINLQRKLKAAKHRDNNTPERLAVREEVARIRLKRLKRTLHGE